MAEQTPDTAPKTPKKRTASATANDIAVTPATDVAEAPQSTFAKVKAQAAGLADDAVEAARNAANTGKDKAAEALGGFSKLAEDAATQVDERLGKTYGEYARKASSTVSDFAEALQSKDVDAIVEDAKAFVRKSPIVAIGAAAAVGFLLTRLIKIGSSDREA